MNTNDTTIEPFDSSFAHTVLFWLTNPESQVDREQFEDALKAFLAESQYAKTNFIGTPPAASREVVDGSFTYMLTVTFESAEAHEAYQQEDAHQSFIERAQPLWNKVVVYDAVGID
jgi:quinol monooxygenase YgiN